MSAESRGINKHNTEISGKKVTPKAKHFLGLPSIPEHAESIPNNPDHLQKARGYLETIKSGTSRLEDVNQYGQELTRKIEDKHISQEVQLTKLTTNFLEANTVYTDIPAALKKLDDYANDHQEMYDPSEHKSINHDQSSNPMKSLKDLNHLKEMQSHLRTIKSENPELESISHYQELANKLQDKINPFNYEWLMNLETNYSQHYLEVQAKVKEFKKLKEKCLQEHDEIHRRLLEATKKPQDNSHTGEIAHSQTALTSESHNHKDIKPMLTEIHDLVEQYKLHTTRYRELSKDIQEFLETVPRFQTHLEQRRNDHKEFKKLVTFFKCHKKAIKIFDADLYERGKRFIDHHKKFMSTKKDRFYQKVKDRLFPEKKININQIKALQERISPEHRFIFRKLQEKISPEHRINIEDLQDLEFEIGSSKRNKWLEELKPKLSDTETKQLNFLQGFLHPVHHLNERQLQGIQRLQREARTRRRIALQITAVSVPVVGGLSAVGVAAIASLAA